MALQSDQESVLEACNANFVKAFEMLANSLPDGLVERSEEFTIVRTGLPTSGFNLVFTFEPPENPAAMVETVLELLADKGVPWRLVSTGKSVAKLAPVIEGLRLTRTLKEPGMILDRFPNPGPPVPEDLEIIAVDEGRIPLVVSTATIGFGAPAGSMDGLIGGMRTLGRNTAYKVGIYLGYVDKKPIATSLRIVSGNIGGIYMVSVLPEYRRRGYGEAMAWRAALDSHREGCSVVYLQASDMGFPVYSRMGFRTIVEYEMWETKTF